MLLAAVEKLLPEMTGIHWPVFVNYYELIKYFKTRRHDAAKLAAGGR